jgi:Flp pilus assembly protein TadD
VTTDQELLRTLPKFPNLSAEQDAQAALLNPRNPDAGPSQAPSYSLGLARIGDFFKARQFEYALIEINQMLAFYPNSPRLLKMKGTVLIKMQQFNLAAVAWEKARSLTPNDRALKRALDRLQYRLQNDTAH